MDSGERTAKRRRFSDPHHLHPASTHERPIDLPSDASEYDIEAHITKKRYTFVDGASLSSQSSRYSNGEGGEDGKNVVLSEALEDENSEFCYGMLPNIAVNLTSGPNSSSSTIPVVFQSPNSLSSTMRSDMLFEIKCTATSRLLSELNSVVEVNTQLYCHSKTVLRKGNAFHKRRRGPPSQIWLLNVIIFGTEDLLEVVGDQLSKRQMYLQDPVGCDRRVRYRNPHILLTESDSPIMADSFGSPLGNLEIGGLEAAPDLLAQLIEEEIPLPETETPRILKTPLFAHQKVALTFMIRREKGWALDESDRDIWRRDRDMFGTIRYKNNVNGLSSTDAPPNFRGGILADDMGLGKTLSMLSLIAHSQANESLPPPPISPESHGSTTPTIVKTTLLVIPPALIQTWEDQFQRHILSGGLKFYVYHGQNRKSVDSLGQYDVVITTYHTVSTIWRQCKEGLGTGSSVFSLFWHRVALDEAHIIQNPHSDLAQACCALQSGRRWAISGTPIQNKLTDLASLVKFLRVYPYSDPGVFEEEISRPWQNRDPQGFLRLKTLVRAITMSRSKTVVTIPPRVNIDIYLDFASREHAVYETVKSRSRALLEEATSSGNERGKTFNALWLLNALRLICSQGLLAQNTLEGVGYYSKDAFGSSSPKSPTPSVVNIINAAANCSNCGADIPEKAFQDLPSVKTAKQRQLSAWEPILCDLCKSQFGSNELDLISSCQTSPIEHSVSMDLGLSIPANTCSYESCIEHMSTKINALVEDISKHYAAEKSVVFSYWTYTLDLVQLMLNKYNIQYTRIDGKTTLPKRAASLQIFNTDDDIRVILVSITCGCAGLDLTAASRVYLLEPHWNPMVEKQALCRVHRVGQTRDVTIIRYLMQNSIEEQIVKLQHRKLMLAQMTFSQGPLPETGISMGALQYLKSVLE